MDFYVEILTFVNRLDEFVIFATWYTDTYTSNIINTQTKKTVPKRVHYVCLHQFLVLCKCDKTLQVTNNLFFPKLFLVLDALWNLNETSVSCWKFVLFTFQFLGITWKRFTISNEEALVWCRKKKTTSIKLKSKIEYSINWIDKTVSIHFSLFSCVFFFGNVDE